MSTENKPPHAVVPVTPQSPIVQGGAPVEVQALEHLFKGLMEPYARSQETAQVEETKRVEIEANTTRYFLKYCFWIVSFILGISAFALYLGKEQLTEKIVIAVISFIAGFGIARGTKGDKH